MSEGQMGREQPMDEVPRPNADPGMTPPVTRQTQQGQQPGAEFYDAVLRARGNMPITSQYKTELGQTPVREDYKPSGWRKLASAAAGGAMGMSGDARGGVELASNINNSPYRNAMTDYSTKLATLERGAGLEQRDVDNETDAINNAYRLGLTYQQFLHKKDIDEQNADTAGRRVDVDAQRADAYDRYVDKSVYDQVQKPTGVLFVNKNNPTDTRFIPGETIASVNAQTQKGFLGVGQRNAGTAARNADTNALRATNDVQMDRENLALRQRQVRVAEQRVAKITGANATQVASARQTALRNMAADPAYRDTIQTGDFPDLKGDLEPAEFDDAIKELEDRMAEILKPGSGQSDDDNDMEEF